MPDTNNEIVVADWNGDGSEDVVLFRRASLHLYEFQGHSVKEVPGVFGNTTEALLALLDEHFLSPKSEDGRGRG